MDSDGSLPRWLVPPRNGWRAEDLDRLPPGAPDVPSGVHRDTLRLSVPFPMVVPVGELNQRRRALS